MSNTKKTIIFLLLCGLILSFAPLALADDTSQATTGKLTSPITCKDAKGTKVECTIPIIIGQIIRVVLGVVGSIALLMFIYGGFLWLTSSGSTDKITKGKNVLVWATIGLAIIFLSYTLVNFVIKGLTSSATSSESSSEETTE